MVLGPPFSMKYAILLLLLLTGCAAKKPVAVQPILLVDPPCLTGPVVLEQCNLSTNPPKCKKVRVRYSKGCERLQVQ